MNFIKKLFNGSTASDYRFAEVSLIGHRENNQDGFGKWLSNQGLLLVVADGLGGHEAGELASAYFCEALLTLAQQQRESVSQTPEHTLNRLIEQAAETMRQRVAQEKTDADAHTTCCIAWISLPDYILTTAHVGDSRVYVFDHKQVLWRTRDHSVTQMLVDMNEITEEEMGTHPEQGSLTRAIGMEGEIKPTIKTYGKLSKGQGVLLCSDGFWEMIEPREICSLIKAKELQGQLTEYANEAVNRAAPDSDNVTVQAVTVY